MLKLPSFPTTLTSALQHAVALHPHVVAYRDGERTYSFADTETTSARLASALLASGLQRGDRIAVLSYNQIEWLQLFFAAARIGVTLVALSARYRDAEIEYMLGDSQAKSVFTLGHADDFDYLAMFARMRTRLPMLQSVVALESAPFVSMIHTEVNVAQLDVATALVQVNDLAMVIYTSGTTGRPKGCALSHASLLASAAGQVNHTRVQPGDLMQLASPVNHVSGITCGILAQLLAGGTCELVASFKAKTVLDMIRRHPPQIMVGVPTMMTLLLMQPESEAIDLRSVRLIITGGSNVDSTLLSQLKMRMPNATIMNLYGLSEASGALVMTPWNCPDDDLMQSIGKPLDGVEVRVISPDGTVLARGEIGELHFRGPGVVNDYIGAAAGSDAFEGGWLRTGDLGLIDARGFIQLKGRMKDMYIQGGFNVYPAEVEAHIATHPAVVMVAGIGVADVVLGEVGRYYVVARAGSELSAADVTAHCVGKMADYKIPRQIVMRDELPLTPAGKIQKASLRSETS